jgi:hypothetical protein
MKHLGQSVRLILATAALTWCVGTARGVSLGASKSDVIAELGSPSAHAEAGAKEILDYPKHVRVVLEDGHVVAATGITLTVEEPVAEPEPIPTPRPTLPRTAKAVLESPKPTIPATPTASPAPTPEPTEELAPTPSPAPANHAPPRFRARSAAPAPSPPPTFLQIFSFGAELPLSGKVLILGLHLVLTLLALKIIFRLRSIIVVHSGLLVIALIDLAVHAVMEVLAPFTAGISAMPAVETLAAWAVMVASLHHFSVKKNLQFVVGPAALVKLSVALLQLIATVGLLLLLQR